MADQAQQMPECRVCFNEERLCCVSPPSSASAVHVNSEDCPPVRGEPHEGGVVLDLAVGNDSPLNVAFINGMSTSVLREVSVLFVAKGAWNKDKL